jgi:hypothetical protein
VTDEKTKETMIVEDTYIFDSAEELLEHADNNNHEELIRHVREMNSDYFNVKNSLVGNAFIIGITGLIVVNTINNAKNGMGNQDTKLGEIIFLAIKAGFLTLESTVIFAAIKNAAKKIIHLIETKKMRKLGNKLVETKYPDEYEKLNDPKRLRKLRKNKREN